MKIFRILFFTACMLAWPAAAQAAVKGDVDGNGIVNGSDVTALYNHLLNGADVGGNADVDGNGVINGSDVTTLYNLLLNPVNNDDDLFALCYATLRSEHGLMDMDHAFTTFVRQVWNLNELTTDEAHCVWGDPGLPDLNHNTWNATNPLVEGLFFRLCDNIDICNSYLTRSGHDARHDAEVRVLRALYYYYLMDLWGKAPFSTTTAATLTSPTIRLRDQLFSFIESELKAVENDLTEPRKGAYGRIDKAAAWLLLARLYLNAEVYIGTTKYSEAYSYAKKVVDSDYTLNTQATTQFNAFQLLFTADNDTNGAQAENILPIVYSGSVETDLYGNYPTYQYSGSTFLVASTADWYIANGFGQNWAGNRARAQFSDLFGTLPNYSSYDNTPSMAGDSRALFETSGHSKSIDDESNFTDGFAYVKWLAYKSDLTNGSSREFADTDVPLMRTAEAYLTLAEANARLNHGYCSATALTFLNTLRQRAGATPLTTASLNELLEEWGREFGFEGRRRIDLIRFNRFGGNTGYNWEWKGGTKEGTNFDPSRNIFPIPTGALAQNPALTQNPGYDITPSKPVLTASSQVDFNNPDNDACFSWTASTVSGYIAPPTVYTLILTVDGKETASTLDAQNRVNLYLTTEQLRYIVKDICGDDSDITAIKAQVTSFVPGYGSKLSNVVTINLQNYSIPPMAIPQLWYITGGFLNQAWSNTADGKGLLPFYAMEEKTYNQEGKGIIEYVGYIPAGITSNDQFVIINKPGEWSPSLRGGNELGGFVHDDWADNNAFINSGFFRLTLDTRWETVSCELYNGTVNEPHATMYIVGAYNGSNRTVTPMTAISSTNNHDWECFITFEDDAKFKFVVTGSVSGPYWGDDTPGLYGTATQTTSNITAPAGSYRVVFNDITGRYMLINTKGSTQYDPDAIEDAYYLVGNMNDWSSTDKSYSMNRSGNVFSFTLPATGTDIYFKVAPESAFRNGHNFYSSLITATTTTDTEATTGSFAVGTGGGAFKIPYDPGCSSYNITFDMKAKTYEIVGVKAPATLFIAGQSNGWGAAWCEPLVSNNDDGVYTGFAYFDGDFAIRTSADSWDGTVYHAGASSGTLSIDGNDIKPGVKGYYAITVNLNNMTYAIGDQITTIGLIGEQSSWSSDFAQLTFNTATGAWEGTATIEGGNTYKFRANNDWWVNWGGTSYSSSTDDLQQNGYNIIAPESGTYKVQLWAWANGFAHATLTKQ